MTQPGLSQPVKAAKQPLPDPRQVGPGIRLLLWDVQSPINLGMLLRVAETYRIPVAALGTERVLADPDRHASASDFACGALQRRGFEALADAAAAKHWRGQSRLVATSIDQDAATLPDFRFRPGDVVVLGNEYDGLPAEVVAAADQRIVIPMAEVWTPKPRSINPIDPARTAPVARDGEANLNVAMAGAIICYQAYVQAMTAWSTGERVSA
jgi:tRNA (cytidine/uridine-2'-O-)-methyltransferase